MKITEYSVEQINDPTGILTGNRYELFLTIEVPEDDELFDESGLQLKVLFYENESESKILNYHFYNSVENKFLDYGLEDDELEFVEAFCKMHIHEFE